ncbi:type IV secretion system protein [Bordetella sp. BOR01]|uniref:type IV secretion system protein n=1 Tax=Bordetella sp. BOR01 TaxID=2854779 RepID=UPI001C447A03|nr:type IV secretion system protein [Bordetella sp. BOR01]MBV7483233.1 type IV secretion system protein [Bordetella sp. BOR01]
MAADFHFYERILSELNGALSGYVTDVATDVIASITPVTTTLLMIYVMLWGWSMMRGMISEPVIDGTTRLIRLSVICAFALTIGNYNGVIADFLWQSPEALANIVSSGNAESTGNVQFLDSLMSQIYDFGNTYWASGNASGRFLPDLGKLGIALAIWGAGLVATAYGAFLLILSKLALSILLGIGPIFILLLIFDGTKRFFDSWIAQTLNYVFMAVMAAGAVRLILTILQTYLTAASTADGVADVAISAALPAVALCVIGALVMMQLSSIASALGGGVAISTLGAVAWAYGNTKGGLTSMRPTNLKRGINKMRADVRIAKNAAVSTATAPLAVYRKITTPRANRVARG